MIREVKQDDANSLCAVYNHYVNETIITFEEQSVSIMEMQNRIVDVAASLPWLVFETDNQIIGYAYASKWKSRCAYRYSVESTIYLSPEAIGRGVGFQLYQKLIDTLKMKDIHSVIGGIALPNPVSIALHEKLGFKKVAHFIEVGWKFNQWIDVGYWELIIPTAEHGGPFDAAAQLE